MNFTCSKIVYIGLLYSYIQMKKKNIVNTVKKFCQLKGKRYMLSFLICSLTCHRGLEDAESFL